MNTTCVLGGVGQSLKAVQWHTWKAARVLCLVKGGRWLAPIVNALPPPSGRLSSKSNSLYRKSRRGAGLDTKAGGGWVVDDEKEKLMHGYFCGPTIIWESGKH